MLIVASKPGQLGNMLFAFAHVIACAIENGFSVANPVFDEYAEHFKTTERDVLCRFPSKKSPLRGNRVARKATAKAAELIARALSKTRLNLGLLRAVTVWDWTTTFDLGNPEFLHSLKPHELVLLRGWGFRDKGALKEHAQKVKEFFEPLDEHQASIEQLVRKARTGADLLVGVHVRHGYKDFDNWRHFYYAPKQYAGFMRQVQELFPGKNIAFLICSDRKQNEKDFAGFNVHFGNDHVVEDMYAFARCDYLLGPPSTYTMWASFYGSVPLNQIGDPKSRIRLDDFVLT
jgi:hypothetical protein